MTVEEESEKKVRLDGLVGDLLGYLSLSSSHNSTRDVEIVGFDDEVKREAKTVVCSSGMVRCVVEQGMIGGGRIQLNGWQQAAVAVGSAVGALLDPRRADLIAALGETTGKHAFERVVERMKKSPEGRVVVARFTEKQRKSFFKHYFPWAVRAGLQSTDLMCVYYEKHFHEDLEDVRRKWGITPAPAAPNQNVP
ncbi:hypothetical protein POTOM_038308 [Populus tomentosa]|uniref:Uncharacterized protein n=1 Tax=Populus tomentosa TaxID=118781 RepID=A0A8X7YS70_POPTO|nr:hypothetical protein POTOM_038308 [Populus tomentosa]